VSPWLLGPYVPASLRFGSAVNFYQTSNSCYADQIINQFQIVDVNNPAPNANLNVVVDEQSANDKH
jgi:hypothetical protein